MSEKWWQHLSRHQQAFGLMMVCWQSFLPSCSARIGMHGAVKFYLEISIGNVQRRRCWQIFFPNRSGSSAFCVDEQYIWTINKPEIWPQGQATAALPPPPCTAASVGWHVQGGGCGLKQRSRCSQNHCSSKTTFQSSKVIKLEMGEQSKL